MSTVKSGANNPPRRAVNILVFSVDGQLVNEFSTLTEAALWLNTSVTFVAKRFIFGLFYFCRKRRNN
jgi:hypothetical protein